MQSATRRGLVFLPAVSAWPPLRAQEVVKSVDSDGNVTFAPAPAPGAVSTETVSLQPSPPQEEVEAARARLERTGKTADQLAREREERKTALERKAPAQAPPRPPPAPDAAEAGGFVYPPYRLPIPRSPATGDHPVYEPGPKPQALPAPVPYAPSR